MTVIDEIRELIDNKVFTKAKIADELGLARQTLYNYLDGTTSPTSSDLAEMSNRLDKLMKTIKPVKRQSGEPGLTGLMLSQKNLDVLINTLEKAVDALSNDNNRLLTTVDNLILIIGSNKN